MEVLGIAAPVDECFSEVFSSSLKLAHSGWRARIWAQPEKGHDRRCSAGAHAVSPLSDSRASSRRVM
ncbi:hypothetical protein Y032_0050g2039 [Ancylostoma ceylanicum]|uniref:Uncharacterized protein n=1 Tax=Ancylostoma ceylanicum TaxID=53326 RepID=A0A016U8P4_9BILA|nr:hypothetical protein Y032_0050g2039 [Ancylostoma ceylanicum]